MDKRHASGICSRSLASYAARFAGIAALLVSLSCFRVSGEEIDGSEQWSFDPPQRSTAPHVDRGDWVQRPLDAFVLSRLEESKLDPSPRADRRTLIRRLSYDLVGLPPTIQATEAFIDDQRPQATQVLVDRLMASPQFGERWARLWLDIARYAEDNAHSANEENSYPNAYLYRNWVIDAWNRDLPYDHFIRLQLAADMMPGVDESDQPALGYLGLAPKYAFRYDPRIMADEWEERIDTVTRGLLGLTVACARCHDHMYDPIPTRDYYALAGIFASTEMFNRPLSTGAELQEDGQPKRGSEALHVVRDGKVRDLHVMLRGNPGSPGELAERQFLSVLSSPNAKPFRNGSGRLELAEAIVSKDNPLTARVIVNRVWAQLIGNPIVATMSNFGMVGSSPTHPELLDNMAVAFMDSEWSLKWLIREIVLSATYQQSSKANLKYSELDAENELIWRMNRKRLSVESWRDTIVMARGDLDTAVGGPSILPQQLNQARRTVYSKVSRMTLDGMLSMFDHPDPNSHSAGRELTTTPTQKLFVLNSPFVIGQADLIAERLLGMDVSDSARIASAYESLFARTPTAREVEWASEFIGNGQQAAEHRSQWQQYIQTLICSNELMMID